MNASIIDVLVGNIQEDQTLLQETEANIEEAKEAKRAVVDRLKDYKKDLSVLLKYASVDQQKKIQELGFDFSDTERGMNPVASLALDIVMKTKGNQLTNGELYNAYVKTFKDENDAFSYTEFNIKTRSLFSTQRLLRKKGKDDESSRDNIISLNGRVISKDQKDESK